MIDVPKDARVRLEPYLKALDMEPDKHWHSVPKWVLTLALSALDAQEAAGEVVTDSLLLEARDAYEVEAGEIPPDRAIRAVIEAVYHAIFAAGERAGLEKAAVWLERESFTNGPATDAAAAIIDRFRTDAPENDAAPTIDVAEFALFDAAKHIATAIRSLKEGTP